MLVSFTGIYSMGIGFFFIFKGFSKGTCPIEGLGSPTGGLFNRKEDIFLSIKIKFCVKNSPKGINVSLTGDTPPAPWHHPCYFSIWKSITFCKARIYCKRFGKWRLSKPQGRDSNKVTIVQNLNRSQLMIDG